jgi:hypothetical protein
MKYLTKAEYSVLVKRDKYWKRRWPYFSYVIELTKTLNPSSVLEIGPYTQSLCGDDTMDIYQRFTPTYRWDASQIPYPINSKSYDVVIALQVFEHLGTNQRSAFEEVRRISKFAILSFPYKWNCPKDTKHHNITKEVIDKWVDSPVSIKEIGKRIVYFFDFTS